MKISLTKTSQNKQRPRGVALCVLLITIMLSGCSSQYRAERLYWQAGQEAKGILNARALEELSSVDLQSIIAAYRRVIDECPLENLSAESHFSIAQIYAMEGRYQEAQQELVTVMHNFSRNVKIASRAQFMLGNFYEKQNNWPAALAEYEKLIDQYPLNDISLRAPMHIVQYYERNKDDIAAEKAHDFAIKHYNKLIEEYDGTSVAANLKSYLALAHLSRKEWADAADVWQAIAEENVNTEVGAKSILAAGQVYTQRIKDLEKAIEVYEDFIEQYPNNKIATQVQLEIGKLCLNNGDTDKAKSIFREIILNYPQETELCADAQAAIIACYIRERDTDMATEELHNLGDNYPDSKLALTVPFFIARQYHLNAQEAKAATALEQAIQKYRQIIDTGSDDARVIEAGRLLGLCFMQQKEWAKAIEYLQKIVNRYPDVPQAQMFLLQIANIYKIELNEPQRAIQVYEELVSQGASSQLANLAKQEIAQIEEGK